MIGLENIQELVIMLKIDHVSELNKILSCFDDKIKSLYEDDLYVFLINNNLDLIKYVKQNYEHEFRI